MLLIMIGYNADKSREICKRKMKNFPHCLSSNMSSMQQVDGFSRAQMKKKLQTLQLE